MACRYSSWSTVCRAKDYTSKVLISRLMERAGKFGVMNELATDGASVYKSAKTEEFLSRFGIKHRVVSAYNPHSNQLAEGAIKAIKRMLRGNKGAQGTLDTNKFLPALLTHRKKADPETTMSSINIIFGRRIKDLMPIRPGPLRAAKLLKQWEAVMGRHHLAWGKELKKHTRELAPLTVGDMVSIQNQHGNTP